MESRHVISSVLAVTIIALLLAGCASTGPRPEYESKDYKERMIARSDGGLMVSTSVLSDVESETVYGVPLAEKDIQPIWIEVENHDEGGAGPVPETLQENTDSDIHYYTDGLRAVLFFVPRPLALSDIEILDWMPLLQ